MVKKTLFCALLIICLFAFCACSNLNGSIVERYSMEAGKKVFMSEKNTPNYTEAVSISLPEGHEFLRTVNGETFIVRNADNLLGATDKEGNVLIECAYEELTVSGNFLCCKYVDYEKELTDDEIMYGTDSNVVNVIYYVDGTRLLDVMGSVAFEAVNDDYCALYYDSYSQIFDKNGVYYFNDKTRVSSRFRYSMCNGLLFGHDSQRGDWFIWQLSITEGKNGLPEGQSFIMSFYTADANTIYSVAYLGNGKFAVVESKNNPSDYDYYEVSEANEFSDQKYYYFKQSCVIFDPVRGSQQSVSLEYPIFGFINKYSPDLTVEQRKALNVNEGYSAVSVPVLGEDKRRVSNVYYVVDDSLNFVIRYPTNMSPTAMKFKDGYGFSGEATDNYAAALYYVNCEPVWLLSDAKYFGQTFNYGRYVLAKVTENGLYYGVLDSNGDVVVDFVYDYISPFSETCAIANVDDKYYRISISGEAELLDDCFDDRLPLYFAVYAYLNGDLIGIKNFNGDVLIDAKYKSISYLGSSDKLYVVLSDGENSTLYVIN